MEKKFVVIVVLVLGAAVLASYLQSGLTGNPIFRTEERVIDLSDFGSEDVLEDSRSILSGGEGGNIQSGSPLRQECACPFGKDASYNECSKDLQKDACTGKRCAMTANYEYTTPDGKNERYVTWVWENCKIYNVYECGCSSEYQHSGEPPVTCKLVKGCHDRDGNTVSESMACGSNVCDYKCVGEGTVYDKDKGWLKVSIERDETKGCISAPSSSK